MAVSSFVPSGELINFSEPVYFSMCKVGIKPPTPHGVVASLERHVCDEGTSADPGRTARRRSGTSKENCATGAAGSRAAGARLCAAVIPLHTRANRAPERPRNLPRDAQL